jgi:hypothetical protein
MKTFGPLHFDMSTDSMYIPAITQPPDRTTTVGSGIDYRDHPGVLTTACDRGVRTKDFWDEARQEVVIHFYCNRPDKKLIDDVVQRYGELHGDRDVVVYVDPVVYGDLAAVFTRWGFERTSNREHPKVPYFVLTRRAGQKLPDRQMIPKESETDRKVREAKSLVRSGGK